MTAISMMYVNPSQTAPFPWAPYVEPAWLPPCPFYRPVCPWCGGFHGRYYLADTTAGWTDNGACGHAVTYGQEARLNGKLTQFYDKSDQADGYVN